jgi:hypothetical protein
MDIIFVEVVEALADVPVAALGRRDAPKAAAAAAMLAPNAGAVRLIGNGAAAMDATPPAPAWPT